ncbi:DMT family transporter [Rhodococcus sp. NPDC049939]|uniref:DMT family transporter n=1 Tax=Rhodococcus sp. NPDC049939 TaxID=3155511 RepID=UPI0033C76621
MKKTHSWMLYAGLLILFWGVWGAFSSTPVTRYGYPDEMIYVIWSFTMIIPAAFILMRQKFDPRPAATGYGLLIGFTGAGGQLVLFKALALGPEYLIFPIISISPAITVLMAIGFLRERLTKLSVIGLVAVMIALVLFSVTSSNGETGSGPWLLLAVLVCVAWGIQAFFMRKAATIAVNEATTFTWMAVTGLALAPVAIWMMGGLPAGAPWQAPALTGATQILNAIGALFLVMALTRGKASVVAPITNALAPSLTVVISLLVYQTLPTVYGVIAIILALGGSTLMVYNDEKRGEADSGPSSEAEPAHPRMAHPT